MGELRRMLDSVAVTARIEDDAFEALERRRRRKERNRRIRAGVVAFTFAATGIGGVLFAFRDAGQAPGPGGTPEDTYLGAVWPERTVEEVKAVQAALYAGDEDLAWRTDPEQVSNRFVSDVLGWTGAVVDLRIDPDTDVPVAEVWTRAASCPSPAEGEHLELWCMPR